MIRTIASKTTALTLTGLALLLIGQSLFLEGSRPISMDEATTLFWTYRGTHGVPARLFYEIHTTAYNVLLAGWMWCFRFDLPSARALSLALSVLTLPLAFAFARKYFGSKVALISTALLAVSPLLLRYSMFARSYPLTVVASMLSSYFYLSLRPKSPRRDRIAYWASTVLMLCAHVSMFSVLAVQWLHFLLPAFVQRDFRKVRFWLLMQAAVVLGYAPVLITVLHRYDLAIQIPKIYAWVRQPGPYDLLRALMFLNGSNEPPLYIVRLADIFEWILIPATLLTAAMIVLIGTFTVRISKSGLDGEKRNVSYLFLWLFLPMTFLFLYSFLHHPVFLGRGFVSSLVPMLCLAGLALSRIRGRVLQAAVLFALVLLSGWVSYTNSAVPPWGSVGLAYEKVSAEIEPGASVFIRPSFEAQPFAYVAVKECFYAADFEPCLHRRGISPANEVGEIKKEVKPGKTVWFFDLLYDRKKSAELLNDLKSDPGLEFESGSEVVPGVQVSRFKSLSR